MFSITLQTVFTKGIDMLCEDDTKVMRGRMMLEEETRCLFLFRLSCPTWDSTGPICAALISEYWKRKRFSHWNRNITSTATNQLVKYMTTLSPVSSRSLAYPSK